MGFGTAIILIRLAQMHLEVLVEDMSGKAALEILLPKIIPEGVTHRIISYRGIGHIPKDLKKSHDASKRALLNTLPKLIRGVGRTFAGYPSDYPAALIIVCDLDNRDFSGFMSELESLLTTSNPRPQTRFCLAVEEGEAWLLGDVDAILASHPSSNKAVLNGYVNDSICGTWEVLADAIFPGGHRNLKSSGWRAIGTEKFKWSKSICPHMDVCKNKSPSFNEFVNNVREVIDVSDP